ncbi:MAG TPA: COR domain-containing protein, partial [Chitinophagales bacterium]|nr:COR domain-containing protein [Chitinophagales bacterium]
NKLPNEFDHLRSLQTLHLSQNKFNDIPRSIKNLPKLECLFLSDNNLHRLHDSFDKLTSLVELHLQNNKLDKLDNCLIKLASLQTLNLSHNQLTTIPKDIGELQQLRHLNLAHNLLNALPAELGKLTQLRRLNLANNRLSNIPLQLAHLNNLSNTTDEPGLNLHNNRFAIPDEVLERDPADIIQYLTDLQLSKNTKPLHEAKVIFLGAGAVGKTSLIKRLIDDDFNPNEPITDGIQIKDWEVMNNGNPIRLHVWDFGGQEILHATHKFFMTARTVYVLVINPRTEDKYGDSELEYWLKLIRSFARENVPVVVAVNKCETHAIDLAKGTLSDKYPNIVAFVETSCKLPKNIDKLKEAIAVAVAHLKHINDLLPKSYFEIKEKLEEINENYIGYNQYEEICRSVSPDFGEQSMQTLVKLLHDLGVMLNFSDDRLLKDTQVLNPEWVTQGVYQIISSEKLINKKGILKAPDIRRILNPTSYPNDNARNYIMDIMQRFELCYQLSAAADTFFVPGAFPKDRPELNWHFQPDELLGFQYHYDVLPASIMALFIVRIHDFIYKHQYWRNGVVIDKDDCLALVKADPQERKIYIAIAGVGNKRDMLTFVRAQFDTLHRQFANLKIAQNIVYVSQNRQIPIDLETLLLNERNKIDQIVVKELPNEVLSVKALLNGIKPDADNQTERSRLNLNQTRQILNRRTNFDDVSNPDAHPASYPNNELNPITKPDLLTIIKYIGAGFAGLITVLAGISEMTGSNIFDLFEKLFGR